MDIETEIALAYFAKKRAEQRYESLRAQVSASMKPNDRRSSRIHDVTVGGLTISDPKRVAKVGTPCRSCGVVLDAPAFTRWAAQRGDLANADQFTQVIPRPVFLRTVLADAIETERGLVVSREGEVLPDAYFETSRPVASFRQSEEQRDAIQTWLAGDDELGHAMWDVLTWHPEQTEEVTE